MTNEQMIYAAQNKLSEENQSLRKQLAEAQKAFTESEKDRALMGLNAVALSDYVHELTGNEGEDDSLTVLRSYVKTLRAEIAKNKAAREWIERWGPQILRHLESNQLWKLMTQTSELRALIQPEEKK